ncbi:MAG TPA: type III pantothenate kinase [Coxiellaceae bacterium]|nr:MAG: pantothenate kinase [Gammaproteobacteria bacterium RBG_16_37_9]HBC71911.1 type III pantothenate kinase [Coxiellaceae bacterium]HBS52030.1 type III pantothenate kinase [Coxiellaceae bacterium]
MILCLDIGNSHIFGGVFNKSNKLLLCFRHATYASITSDQLGTFLKNVLQENNFDPKQITAIALCSVVPSIDYSLRAACKKYFKISPFVLNSSIKTKIKIKTINPAENGADIIAGIIAATHHHPQKNLLIIDLGTVTTIAAVTKNREYLGVTFIPGIQTAMNSLQTNAAKLFTVEIIKPKKALGRSTTESIQSGLFFGHLGAIKEIISKIIKEKFPQKKPLLIATGGFAHLFKHEKIFTHLEPDLVLHGIKIAYEINKNGQ